MQDAVPLYLQASQVYTCKHESLVRDSHYEMLSTHKLFSWILLHTPDILDKTLEYQLAAHWPRHRCI